MNDALLGAGPPHGGGPLLQAGAPLDGARAALVLVHGRGGTAAAMLGLAGEVAPPDFVALAPQAAEQTWYPHPFLAPMPSNEPGLSSGLAVLADLLAQLAAAGIPAERTVLLGFSQGACLMLEFVARHARRYGGVVGLSGGLIGPDGTSRAYPGALAGTPVFLGCSDVDVHIPTARVEETAAVLERLGGTVTTRLYPQMGHTINDDELAFVRDMLRDVAREA